jgi:hypothetical protein
MNEWNYSWDYYCIIGWLVDRPKNTILPPLCTSHQSADLAKSLIIKHQPPLQFALCLQQQHPGAETFVLWHRHRFHLLMYVLFWIFGCVCAIWDGMPSSPGTEKSKKFIISIFVLLNIYLFFHFAFRHYYAILVFIYFAYLSISVCLLILLRISPLVYTTLCRCSM